MGVTVELGLDRVEAEVPHARERGHADLERRVAAQLRRHLGHQRVVARCARVLLRRVRASAKGSEREEEPRETGEGGAPTWKAVACGLSVARMPQSEPMTHAHTSEPPIIIAVRRMYSG